MAGFEIMQPTRNKTTKFKKKKTELIMKIKTLLQYSGNPILISFGKKKTCGQILQTDSTQ